MIVNMLTLGAAGYPEILSQIHSPPSKLYFSGSNPTEWIDSPKVAIVGSRKMSSYGYSVTLRFAKELAEAGVVIISGLAFGIDVTAHQSAIGAGGTTAAVLASGLDDITPRSHANIARQITQKGTLLSEYPPGSQVHRGNFVTRNRIISGLCDVLLVTEAALKSGSLHTARFALEQGKTVMAVPGNITSPGSEGCNNLIKSGAFPATSADDVLFALKINPAKHKSRPINVPPKEKMVLGLILDGISSQEDIAAAAKMEGQELASLLTMLELGGYIRPAGGGAWVSA